jgi:hypothetical protein
VKQFAYTGRVLACAHELTAKWEALLQTGLVKNLSLCLVPSHKQRLLDAMAARTISKADTLAIDS